MSEQTGNENTVASTFSHRMGALIKKLLSMPKTVYFNFRCFDIRTAISLPVLVAYEVRLKALRRGAVRVDGPVSRFMVKIGFGGTEGIMPHRSNVCLTGGQVVFHGKADLGAGISLTNAGQMDIGDNCYMNNNCTLWCTRQITIGRDFLSGWNVMLRDSDGHCIVENGVAKERCKPIIIGDHVWIAADCTLLKGAKIGDNSVLAMKSLLSRPYPQPDQLLAGTPAVPVRDHISWVR